MCCTLSVRECTGEWLGKALHGSEIGDALVEDALKL